jgi:predicted transcriptional regulator
MSPGPDPEIDDLSVLETFLSSSEPAFVPSEVAENLDVTTEGARNRMNKLAERGLLEKKKPGQRTVMYWITEEGTQYYFDNS